MKYACLKNHAYQFSKFKVQLGTLCDQKLVFNEGTRPILTFQQILIRKVLKPLWEH